MKETMIKYNLQFFAEGEGEEDGAESNDDNTAGATGNGDNTGENVVDTEAFAELISEKDKQIEQLQNDVKMLKKSNADLTVKISAQNKPDKSIGETIVDFCDTRKVK